MNNINKTITYSPEPTITPIGTQCISSKNTLKPLQTGTFFDEGEAVLETKAG